MTPGSLPRGSATNADDGRDSVVIGMAVRLPGASDLDSLWKLLTSGDAAISDPPLERWRALETTPPQKPPGPKDRGGYLAAIDQFDYAFFGISEREAVQIDPQQRLMLEVVWEALEDAGIRPADHDRARIGVFIGASTHDFERVLLAAPEAINGFSSLGSSGSGIANRISHAFDLRGPSLTVDTACSSAMTALHLASQALRCGEIDVAVVGGVNVILSSEIAGGLEHMGVLSATGRCAPFDAGANGFVRGEGALAVILRRQDDARASNDRVYARILGSAVSQDGRRSAMGVPSTQAQAELIGRTLKQARVDPREVGCVEAFGSGTAVGDAMELRALAQIFVGRQQDPLVLGATKGQFGHSEAASGLVSLAKVALQLKHETLLRFPDTFQQLRDSAGQQFRFPAQVSAWPSKGRRIAGVSAFGFGGTNAHVVLGQADAVGPSPARGGPPVLVFTANGAEALRQQIVAVAEEIAAAPHRLDAIAANLAFRRTLLRSRKCIAVEPRHSLHERLQSAASSLPDDDAAVVVHLGDPEDALVSHVAELAASDALLATHWQAMCAAVGVASGCSKPDAADPEKSLFLAAAAQALLVAHWFRSATTPVRLLAHGAGLLAAGFVSGLLDLFEGVDVPERPFEDLVGIFARAPEVMVWRSGSWVAVETARELGEELALQAERRRTAPPAEGAVAFVASSAVPSGWTAYALAADAQTRARWPAEALRALVAGGVTLKAQFAGAPPPRTETLPTYPWQRVRIPWPASRRSSGPLAVAQPNGGEVRTLPATASAPLHAYDIVWRKFAAADEPAPPASGRWIVLCSEVLDATLVSELSLFAKEFVTVGVDRDADAVTTFGRTFALEAPDWPSRVMAEFAAQGFAPSGIEGICVVASGRLGGRAVDAGQLRRAARELAVAGRLVAEVERHERTGAFKVIALDFGAPVAAADVTNDGPYATIWSSFAQALTFEHPHLRPVCIDLRCGAGRPGAGALANAIRAGVAAHEARLLLTVDATLVPRLRRLPADVMSGPAPACDPRAAYLVVGAGDLGMASAQGLASWGAKRIVLASTSALRPPALAKVEDLRRQGVVIEHVQVDASDEAATAALFGSFGGDRPRLAGVVFAAGKTADAMIATAAPRDYRALFESQGLAAHVVSACVRRAAPDFFLLHSTALTVLGGPLQGPLASSFAVAEGVAGRSERGTCPTIVVRWGPWRPDGVGEDGGSFVKLIDPSVATRAMLALVGAKRSGTVVLPLDIADLARFYPQAGAQGILAELHDVGAAGRDMAYTRGDLATVFVAPESQLEREIADIWKRLLTIDRVGINDDFFELGGDSLIGGLVIDEVNRLFGVTLSTESAFSAFTVAALAEHVERELLAEIDAASGPVA